MMRYWKWLAMAASVVLAVVFLAAGVGKLLGQSAFLLELSRVFINSGLTSFTANVLPWLEILLGLCLLLGIVPQLAGGVASLLVAAFIFHNSWLVTHGLGYQACGCLGVLDRITGGKLSTTGALYVDAGLFLLALAVYFLSPGRFFDLRPWLWKMRTRSAPPAPQRHTSPAA